MYLVDTGPQTAQACHMLPQHLETGKNLKLANDLALVAIIGVKHACTRCQQLPILQHLEGWSILHVHPGSLVRLP